MKFIEGLFVNPPKSCWGCVSLSHLIPFTTSAAVATIFSFLGVSYMRCLLTVCVGGAVSAFTFLLFPIPVLGPVGGKYNVGIKHISCCDDEVDMMPPLVVFYPTEEVPQRRGISYIPFGDIRFLTGIASRSKMPLLLLKDFLFVRLKAVHNAAPVSLFDKNGTPFPVIIFSHGLYGYHCLYSCLLSDLAARGTIVVGVGHLDGSAAFMRDEVGSKEVTLKEGDWESVLFETAHLQRVAEMRRILTRVFENRFWTLLGFTEFDVKRYLSCSPRVNLCGHSFGAATALSAAVQEEFEPKLNKGGRVQCVALFDPWYLPLEKYNLLRQIENSHTPYTTPTLMIHSDCWFNNQPNWDFFCKVQKFLSAQPFLSSFSEEDKQNFFVTVKTRNTNHYSVSDVVLLSPIIHGETHAMVPPRAQIVDWCNAVLQFCNRHKKSCK